MNSPARSSLSSSTWQGSEEQPPAVSTSHQAIPRMQICLFSSATSALTPSSQNINFRGGLQHSSLHSASSGWLLAEDETPVLGICTGFVSRLLSPDAAKYFPQCHTLSRVTGKGSPSPPLRRKNKLHFHITTKLPWKKAVVN